MKMGNRDIERHLMGCGHTINRSSESISISSIHEKYGSSTADLVKQYIHINQQLATSLARRRFLLKTRSYDCLPSHINNILNIKFESITFHSNTCKRSFIYIKQNFVHRILKIEITDICCHIRFLYKKLNIIYNKINQSNLHAEVINSIICTQKHKFDNISLRVNYRYQNKFKNIIDKQRIRVINDKEYSQLKNKWLVNLSNVIIPENVKSLVSLGSKFNCDTSTKKSDIIDSIKNFEHTVQYLEFKGNQNHSSSQNKLQEIRCNFTKYINTHIQSTKHITIQQNKLSYSIKCTKAFLKSYDQLMFVEADKSHTTVCIDKNMYLEKCNILLEDVYTYHVVKSHKTLLDKLQKTASELAKFWNNCNYLDNKYKDFDLTFTNTTLSRFYGSPKLHKNNIPFRPIVSTINSPVSFIAHEICNVIQKCCPLPASNIPNSLTLITKLQDIIIPDNYVLLSLDVISLFTNVTMDLVLESLYRRINKFIPNSQFPFREIIVAIEFIFNNLYFVFNNKVYKQIKGCPMGLEPSPIFADLVMDDLERECLSKLDFQPLFFLRYVDDVITCVPKNKVQYMLDIFNGYDDNLKFTYEIENNHEISFLDVLLIRENNRLITNWYRKPTFSGRLLNFQSNHPKYQKIGIIYHLVDKAYSLSSKKFQLDNINFIKNILYLNDYPPFFVNKYINKRIMYISSNRNDKKINQINKSKIYSQLPNVKIPFKNSLFNSLKHLLNKYNIIPIPDMNEKLSCIIQKGKDKLDKFDKVNVVYKIPCKTCGASYTGETKRALKKRVKEHKDDVEKKKCNKVLAIHCNNNHKINWEKISILDIEKNYWKRLTSEMLNIHLQEQSINKKEDTKSLHKSYVSIIKNIKKFK